MEERISQQNFPDNPDLNPPNDAPQAIKVESLKINGARITFNGNEVIHIMTEQGHGEGLSEDEQVKLVAELISHSVLSALIEINFEGQDGGQVQKTNQNI